MRTTTFSNCYGSTAAKFDAGDEEINQDTIADAGGTMIDTASTNGARTSVTRGPSPSARTRLGEPSPDADPYSGFSWTSFHSATIYLTAIALQQFT
jgi:hypothetical protein